MVIIIHPYSSRVEKDWYDDGWREVMKGLSAYGGCFVVGSKEDSVKISKLIKGIPNAYEKTDETIKSLCSYFSMGKVSLCIGVDSCIVLMADSFDIPTITLFNYEKSGIWKAPNSITMENPYPQELLDKAEEMLSGTNKMDS